MTTTAWVDPQLTVYVLRGERGVYQAVTADGQVDERLTLPLDVTELGSADD